MPRKDNFWTKHNPVHDGQAHPLRIGEWPEFNSAKLKEFLIFMGHSEPYSEQIIVSPIDLNLTTF